MLSVVRASFRAGMVTTTYPHKVESGNSRGRPVVELGRCTRCGECAAVCPAASLGVVNAGLEWTWRLDLARCVFCGLCAEACAEGALAMSHHFEQAVRSRDSLVVVASKSSSLTDATSIPESAMSIDSIASGRLRRSLHVRHMAAGSDNSCDWEIAALLNPVYDVQRLGIDFVASPRHADLLLVTGAVTRNLEPALLATYEAIPAPQIVVAAGDEACGGGILQGSYAVAGGVDRCLPVDVYIPGDPPSPLALIDGLLLATGRARSMDGH